MTVVEVTAKELVNPNKAIMDRARELMEDDEFIEQLEKWTERQCEQVRNYSDQNRAMLLVQLGDRRLIRKLTFVELHTFPGWSDAGRMVVKGSKGFVISAQRTSAKPIDAEGNHVKDENGQDIPGKLAGFRWLFLFDVSQTQPMTTEELAARQARKSVPRQRSKGRKR